MDELEQSRDNHFIPMTSVSAGKGHEVLPDLYYFTNQIVNVIFIGRPDSGSWVLVDAGMPDSGAKIIEKAEARFGKVPPKSILLTHGHFDHVGGIVELLEYWPDLRVYSHPLEFPFLTGSQAYPKPDSGVDGGLLAKISFIYPHEPIQISSAVEALPDNHSVPGLPDWRWMHTPGHSPGHVSFYRPSDGVLLAGDAFVTVRQDSLYQVLVQKKEVNGPPPYLTTHWPAARDSVRILNTLQPQIAITGHGTHMEGEELRRGLGVLSEDFDRLALPRFGRYVKDSDRERKDADAAN